MNHEPVPQVYVVDDDISVREALSSLIRSAGLSVRTFASASESLGGLEKERPGCLVLDIQLPDINGFELQQRLAMDDIQIPIIFLTRDTVVIRQYTRRHDRETYREVASGLLVPSAEE